MRRAARVFLLFAMIAATLAITGCARREAAPSSSQLPAPPPASKPVVGTRTPEDDDMPEDLLQAAETGDADRVAELLAAGIDPHAAGEHGETPLHRAASEGHAEALERLLRHSASPRDDGGRTPLHCAAESGDLDIARLLIRYGADVDAEDDLCRTPLYITDDLAMAELLLDHGADPNAQIHLEYGYSGLLHGAAGAGDIEMARLLIKHGAVVDLGDRWGCAPLHAAAECGHVEMVEFLLDNGADVNGQGFHRQKPLHYAAREGHLEVVKTLIRYGAEVNVQRKDGSTPLSRAVDEGHTEVAEFLRAHGAKELEELGPPR